jgi:hypothetical protein
MKLKIFFLIFSLQFILYSCTQVKYYKDLIEKYSDEVLVSPNYDHTTGFAGFVLDVKDFKENEEIYFQISTNKLDAIDISGLRFVIKFESTFDTTEETDLNEFSKIDSITYITENSITTNYFKTTKVNPDLNFLKVIFISDIYVGNVRFKNTKEEESEDDWSSGSNLALILIIVFILVFLIIAVIIFICNRYKRAKVANALYDQNQQMYNQPQIYGQEINAQPVNVQQQMNNQQGTNTESNLNKVEQNPAPLPSKQQENSPINQK